jgi:hypothetical protein
MYAEMGNDERTEMQSDESSSEIVRMILQGKPLNV